MQPWLKKNSLLKGSRYATRLEPIEREMLGDSAALVADKLMERIRTAPKDELAELTGMPSGHSEAPQDAGLARLLPSFFAEGEEEVEGDAALTRQLNETEIIRAKLMNLYLIGEKLGPDGSVQVSLTDAEATLWLTALADIRNYHHAQLQELIAAPNRDADHVIQASNYLDWLGYHQESLLEAMMGPMEDIPPHTEGDSPQVDESFDADSFRQEDEGRDD